MTKDKALKLALELIQDYVDEYGPHDKDSGVQYAITAIKEALAQTEQDWSMLEAMQGSLREHMARIKELESQLKPLTDEELFKLWVSVPAETENRFAFARAIEAAHGIKELKEYKK